MRHDAGFVLAQTVPGHAPLVPEIALHLASEITPIWQATEDWLAEHNVEPPFWAFAWPGGQALARHVLDHPDRRRRPARARFRRRLRHRRHRLRAGRRGLGRGGGDRPAGTRRDRAECRGERRLGRRAGSRHRRRRLPLGPHPVRRRLLRGADDRRISCPGCARWHARRGLARRPWPRLSAATRVSPPSPATACRPAWSWRIAPSGR